VIAYCHQRHGRRRGRIRPARRTTARETPGGRASAWRCRPHTRRHRSRYGKEPIVVVADDPGDRKGALKIIGGSQSDNWNNILANQAALTLWVKNSNAEARDRQYAATVAGLVGIAPRDELEEMLAAQMLASHNAAMECYRRAMIAEQPFEGRRESLSQANKLSRTYAVLLDALNRHRGRASRR
jgi:hypothetical protein